MKKTLFLTTILLTGFIYSCKDKETTEPAKTLDKSQITNKNWESTDGLIGMYLRSDFKSCGSDGKLVLGTWKWANNSDTLLIDDLTFGEERWIVKYCTATEMSAQQDKSDYTPTFKIK